MSGVEVYSVPERKTVYCDFDGVIHSYVSGWQGPDVIPDPPVPGAIEWLNEIGVDYDIKIFTTRARYPEAIQAIHSWLKDQGFVGGCEVTCEKGPGLLYIDDRAWRFRGVFPSARAIRHGLTPWRVGDRDFEPLKVKLAKRGSDLDRLQGKQSALKLELRRVRLELLIEVLRHTYTEEGVQTWLAANERQPWDEKLAKARSLTGMVAT